MNLQATETIGRHNTPAASLMQKLRSIHLSGSRQRKVGIQFPLWVKFIAGISVLLCLFMLAVITIVGDQMRQSILEEFAKRGLTVARNLAAVNTSFITTYNYVKIEQSTDYVVKENDLLYATVIFFDGESAAYSGREDLKQLVLSGPLHDKALKSQKTLIQQSTHHGLQYCEIGVPIFLDQQKWATVRVGFPLDHMHSAVQETRKMLLLFGSLALVIGCLAGFAVARKITQPIGKLVEGVEAISLGDFDDPIHIDTRDEIGYLGRRFSTMQSTIRENLQLLTRKNQELLDSNTELRNEIHEREQAEAALRRRDEILKAVTFASERFLREPHWQDTIEQVLEKLARAMGVSRLSLVQSWSNVGNPQPFRPLYEWAAEGIASPDEYGEKKDREDSDDCDSPESLAVIVDERTWGYLRVVGMPIEIGWRIASQDALKTVAGNLGAAIQRELTLERVQAANRAKDDFMANMSHELRTPLNHIIGFTELVADRRIGPLNEKQEEYLNFSLNSGRHLLSLINDILDLSKIEAGKMELDISPVDLNLLLVDCFNFVKEKALNHNIQLSSDLAKLPPQINADERKLKQVLFNILSNAVKFTPDGGQVSLRARMVDYIIQPGRRRGDNEFIVRPKNGQPCDADQRIRKFVEVAVTDTGIGIPEEDMLRIFDRFDQLKTSQDRKHEGTGLGLSLAKCLVELHGGRIWAESTGEGHGSTFRFVIPTPITIHPDQCREQG